MTAKEITQKIIDRYGTKEIVIPNYYNGFFEADCLRVTGKGHLIEYEIKVSIADLKKDFDKKSYGENKHEILKNGKSVNRFFFVVPANLIDKEDVPKHCGLIYVTENTWKIVRNAPILHKETAPIQFYKTLCLRLYYRGKSK